MNLIKLFYLINFLCVSFAYNPIKIYSSNVKKSVLFYPAKLNKFVPYELYNDFLSKLGKDKNVYIAQDNHDDNELLVNGINTSSDVCIISHSSSANDAVEFCKKSYINKLILIDPIDDNNFNSNNFLKNNYKVKSLNLDDVEEKIHNFLETDKFEILRNMIFKNNNNNLVDDNDDERINKVLILNTKMSKRWKLIPPIPPMNKYSLNTDNLDNKELKELDKYGHFDILDTPWANLIHNTVSKGASSRENDNIKSYHDSLVEIINIFYEDD